MSLGQLFFFLKELDKIDKNWQKEKIASLNLAGVKNFPVKDFEDLDETQTKRKIRDVFSKNYTTFLHENKLFKAENFWKLLTSSLKTQNISFLPETDFQQKLYQWMKSGFLIDNLAEVISNGNLATDDEDVAIFYGLKVIFTFSNLQDLSTNKVETKTRKAKGELSPDPQILVLTDNHKFPLFVNLNIVTMSFFEEESVEEILAKIRKKLQQFSEIKLVIVDTQDTTGNLVNFLSKKLSLEVMVSSVDFSGKVEAGKKTYFDTLAKSTLGVNLK